MNFSNYPKPQSLLRQDSGICGTTWRGYLTRATLLAIGFGGYILLTKKIDLSKNGKRCFYALRKYFPRGKNDGNGKDRKPAVCLGGSKTGIRGSCGLLLCTKCLTCRYCEIRRSIEDLRNGFLRLFISSKTKSQLLMIGPDPKDSIAVNECRNKTPRNVCISEPDPTLSPSCYLLSTNCWDEVFNYLVRNLPSWSVLLAVVLVAIKFQVIPWWEFIGYESIFDFLIPLVVMPSIYIWFMYRRRNAACRR